MKKANLLSKAELKKVMGGTDEAQRGPVICLSMDCSFYMGGTYYYGSCGSVFDMQNCPCLAVAPNGSIISQEWDGCHA